jgi:type III secretion protein C
VLRQVESQRLANSRNMARSSADGNLVVSGTPRFVEQVTALVQGGSTGTAAGSGHGVRCGRRGDQPSMMTTGVRSVAR